METKAETAIGTLLEAVETRLSAMEARAIASDLFIMALIEAAPDIQGFLARVRTTLDVPLSDSSRPDIVDAAKLRVSRVLAALERASTGAPTAHIPSPTE